MLSKEMHSLFVLLVLVSKLLGCASLQFQLNPKDTITRIENPIEDAIASRRNFVSGIGLAILSVSAFPDDASAKSYSSNARNLERMNTGDMSGGSLYDNNPKSDAGKKRRAITGCKSPTAREEAAEVILKVRNLSEKECNQMVLEGNAETMLQALRNLDCPSCPYGINSSRKSS
jgi:hypothetical protein